VYNEVGSPLPPTGTRQTPILAGVNNSTPTAGSRVCRCTWGGGFSKEKSPVYLMQNKSLDGFESIGFLIVENLAHMRNIFDKGHNEAD
jgi:hypothetical protein